MKPLGRRTYTTREAAAILGISPSTVIAAVDRGDLPGVRLGSMPGAKNGRVLVLRQPLDDMLAGVASTSPTATTAGGVDGAPGKELEPSGSGRSHLSEAS